MSDLSPAPMPHMPEAGLRERKRVETRRRIADCAMRRFVDQGFEATTMDEIARDAGIARRTLFHYFAGKEALLFSYEETMDQAFAQALASLPRQAEPFAAMRAAMLSMVARFADEEARVLDRLLRSSEALRARKQAGYERQERRIVEALAAHWPEPETRRHLQVVAMVGVGVLRLAADRWTAEADPRPLTAHVQEGFEIVKRISLG